jgi:alpha-L-fucosidase 2
VQIGLEDNLRSNPSSNVTCDGNGVHIRAQTQEDIGMIIDARVQTLASTEHSSCAGSTLVVSAKSTKEITAVFAAGTNYDPKAGTKATNYTFKGVDPASQVVSTIHAASQNTYAHLYNSHVHDHGSLYNDFALDLPDPDDSANIPTAALMTNYTYQVGNPYIENLLFDYGRYLFIASSRPGSLPPNLQGIWSEQLSSAWSADYHVDINLEM